MTQFSRAYDLYLELELSGSNTSATASTRDPAESQLDSESSRLLIDLGYLRQDQSGGYRLTCDEPARHGNRLALLKLASRLDRAFQLPLPYAPNAFFFGGVVAPSSFDIAEHTSTGVGGRGASLGQAFESCVGEAAEYLSFIEREEDPLLQTADQSVHVSDGAREWITAGLGWSCDADLSDCSWIEAHSLNDDHLTGFPSELVLRSTPKKQKSKRLTESTGIAAGPTYEAATISALLEVVERDAVALWWYAGAPACRLNPSLELFEFAQSLLCEFRPNSPRASWLLDLTSDLQIPVFAAISAEADGSAVVAGFSAHTHPESAIKGAVLELCQMELAQQISLQRYAHLGPEHLGETDRHWLDLYQRLALQNYPQLLPDELSQHRPLSTTDGSLAHLVSRLTRGGYEAYKIDLTRTDISIPVARVIVPGLQSAKPDWISQRLRDTCARHNRSLLNLKKHPSII